jgi:hypothetical protein
LGRDKKVAEEKESETRNPKPTNYPRLRKSTFEAKKPLNTPLKLKF